MLKRLLIVLIAVFFIATGVFYYLNDSKAPLGSDLPQANSIAGQYHPDLAAVDDSTLASRIVPGSALLISFFPTRVNSVWAQLNSFWDKLLGTKVAQKLNLNQQLKHWLDFEIETRSALVNQAGFSVDEFKSELLSLWNSLTEVSLALSPSQTNPAAGSTRQMPILLARFNTSDAARLLQESFAKLAADSKLQESLNGVRIAKDDLSVNAYKIELTHVAAIPLNAKITFEDRAVLMDFTNGAGLVADKQAQSFAASNNWQLARQAHLREAAVISYFDSDALLSDLAPLLALGANSATSAAQAQRIPTSGARSFSARVANGLQSLSCSVDAKDSAQFTPSRNPKTTRSLIDTQTLLAVSIPKVVVLRWLNDLVADWQRLAASGISTKGESDWKTLAGQVSQIRSELEAAPFDELGLVALHPVLGPFPDLALVLGSNSEISLPKLADLINRVNNIADNSGQPKNLVAAELSKDSHGKDQLMIALNSSPNRWLGTLVQPNLFLLAKNRLILEGLNGVLAEKDANKKPLSAARFGNLEEAKYLDAADGFLFVSARALIDVVQPYTPLLTSQAPNLGIEDADIEEAASLLKVDIVSSFKIFKSQSHGLTCAETLVGLTQ